MDSLHMDEEWRHQKMTKLRESGVLADGAYYFDFDFPDEVTLYIIDFALLHKICFT